MKKQKALLYTAVVIIVIYLGLTGWRESQTEMKGLRIACNHDAAGLLIEYLAGGGSTTLEVVDMSYQQLQDCCSSQTELALAAGNFDMAVLCPDSADKLIASGQPYQILGTMVVNAKILVTNQDKIPRTVGYMNGRETQKRLVWSNLNDRIVMKPILPAGLSYALERNAVEGIVLDIMDAIKIEGYHTPLPSPYPTSVLVVHEKLLDRSELARFIQAYNQAVEELNREEVLKSVLAKKAGIGNGNKEVRLWQEMGIQFQTIDLQS